MAASKVIGFNANGIWMQRYELRKQLQDLHIDVALWLCSQRHISNPTRGSLFPIITFIGLAASRKKKGIPHNHVDLCYMCDTYT
jgi:hypothetical protein